MEEFLTGLIVLTVITIFAALFLKYQEQINNLMSLLAWVVGIPFLIYQFGKIIVG